MGRQEKSGCENRFHWDASALKAGALAGAFALLPGCTSLADINHNGLAENIEENALTLNEAHTRAMTAIITANVLRARDRWPTNYTTLSGIKSNPTRSQGASASLTPLGLGNAPAPFANSGALVSRSEQANAEYSINPFSNSDRSQSLLRPISPAIFANYWNAGWPRDTLLWLFVDSIRYPDSDRFVFVNGDDFSDTSSIALAEANKFRDLIAAASRGDIEFGALAAPSQKARGCAAFDAAFLRATLGQNVPANLAYQDLINATQTLTGKKLVLAAEEAPSSTPADATTPVDRFGRKLLLCDTAETRWGFTERASGRELAEIRTRSFDDMIYFLGETLRQSPNGDEGLMNGVVLFHVYRATPGVNFAVQIRHAGETYYVAPQHAVPIAGVRDDQSGNVIGLLNQLYQFAQSDDFLRAPDARLR